MATDSVIVSRDVFKALAQGGAWQLEGIPPEDGDSLEVMARIDLDEYVTVILDVPGECIVILNEEWLAGAFEICRQIREWREAQCATG